MTIENKSPQFDDVSPFKKKWWFSSLVILVYRLNMWPHVSVSRPGSMWSPQSKRAAANTPQAPAAPCTAKASMGSSTWKRRKPLPGATQNQAELTRRNGRGGGFYKWKGSGTWTTLFVWHWNEIFVRCFFVQKTSHQYKGKENILNTRLIHQSEILQKNSHGVGIPSSKKKPVIRFFKTTRLRNMGARIKLGYETHQ